MVSWWVVGGRRDGGDGRRGVASGCGDLDRGQWAETETKGRGKREGGLTELRVLDEQMAATTSSTITPHLTRMAIGAKSAVIAHGGTMAKICESDEAETEGRRVARAVSDSFLLLAPRLPAAQAIPKAITSLTSSLGGLTALQAEVLSILASPLTPSSLRARGFHILSSLRKAHAEDKSRSAAEKEADLEQARKLEEEAKQEERMGGDEVDEKTGEIKRSWGVVEEKGMRREGLVRKHGVFIGERKHFEVSGRVALPACFLAFLPSPFER